MERRAPSGGILPAPACDLLDRLTSETGVQFTLTDPHGVAVASTGGIPAGQAVATVSAALESRTGTVFHAEQRWICIPVILASRLGGALLAHGETERTREIAAISAVAIGFALEFAEAATSVTQEATNPGWLLYRLLRGSREEALHARVVASIYGWNLCVQRTALAIFGNDPGLPRRVDPVDVIARALGSAERTTPYGQVDDSHWVILPEYPMSEARRRLRDLADRIRRPSRPWRRSRRHRRATSLRKSDPRHPPFVPGGGVRSQTRLAHQPRSQ